MTRSPSSALYPFFGGRVPRRKHTSKKKGTLILTSLQEDLDEASRDPLVEATLKTSSWHVINSVPRFRLETCWLEHVFSRSHQFCVAKFLGTIDSRATDVDQDIPQFKQPNIHQERACFRAHCQLAIHRLRQNERKVYFHLLQNMFYFPLLVLKGIYHYKP